MNFNLLNKQLNGQYAKDYYQNTSYRETDGEATDKYN